jgi:hypothetical protein
LRVELSLLQITLLEVSDELEEDFDSLFRIPLRKSSISRLHEMVGFPKAKKDLPKKAS